ncbi:MAG: hypothetical protein ABJB66_01200 [Gemmatimonadaceae bacterium]
MNRKICALLAGGLAFSALPACESGSGANTAGTITPTISNLTTTGSSVEISTGTSALVTFSLSRGGSYDGVVTMSVEGLPTGLTATFDPPGLGVQDPTGKVRFTAASNAPAGSYVVTLRASGPNVTAVSTTFTVKVAVPGVDVVVGTSPISIHVDTSITVPIRITRTGGLFDPVTLSAVDLPSNILATFSPANIAPSDSTSVMTLTALVGASQAPASMTVRATAIGNVDVKTPVPLTVLDATHPAYRLIASIPALDATVNTTATQFIQMPKAGGFFSNVTFSLEGAPAGTVATFDPPVSVSGSTLSIVVPVTAPQSDVTVTVRGKTPGLADRTTTFILHVVQVPGVVLRTVPLTITRGASNILLVSAQRQGGYSGSYVVTLDPLPLGFNATGFPTNVAASTSQALNAMAGTLTVDSTVPAGVYTFVYRVTGSGGITSSTAQSVTVPAN